MVPPPGQLTLAEQAAKTGIAKTNNIDIATLSKPNAETTYFTRLLNSIASSKWLS
jgi:hypothetical protein